VLSWQKYSIKFEKTSDRRRKIKQHTTFPYSASICVLDVHLMNTKMLLQNQPKDKTSQKLRPGSFVLFFLALKIKVSAELKFVTAKSS